MAELLEKAIELGSIWDNPVEGRRWILNGDGGKYELRMHWEN